jgi:phenylacetate-CoA ligase
MVIALSAGRGNLDNQIRVGQMVGVTVIEQLPSLALKYFERAKELGIDIKQLGLRQVIALGESWSEAYKKRVESEYGVQFRAIYGSVDAGLVSAECEAREGMHTFLDLCSVEVIDPETEEVLNPGEEGELVITLLWNEATPIIRYRTGDMASLLPYEPCPCGRTHPRMSAVKGRLAHSIKVKGKRVFPIDVEEVMVGTPGLGEDYQIIVDKPGELDKLKVKVEYKPEVGDPMVLKKRVEEALKRNLAIESEVELVPLGTLGRPLFKAQRLVTTYA